MLGKSLNYVFNGMLWATMERWWAVVLFINGAMRVLFSHGTGIAWVQIVEGQDEWHYFFSRQGVR